MSDRGKFDEALHVRAEPDEVAIDGPDGIAGALTPRAALLSARRLEAAAQATARDTRSAWRLRKRSDNPNGLSSKG